MEDKRILSLLKTIFAINELLQKKNDWCWYVSMHVKKRSKTTTRKKKKKNNNNNRQCVCCRKRSLS